MAEVVFFHGIGQQKYSDGEALERVWLEALATGVGDAWAVEDAMARSEMAFYADTFVTDGAQGWDPVTGEWTDEELELAEELAAAWIRRAAGSESNDRLRREGEVALSELAGSQGREAQGPGALVRSAIAVASKIHFFAEGGYSVAENIMWRDLKQVSGYMAGSQRDEIRSRADAALAAPDVRIVVAHSLGTVVAYEAVSATDRPIDLFVTIGSPLGLTRPIYRRLTPRAAFPSNVARWVNFADPDDIVAAAPVLAKMFPSSDGRYVEDRAVVNDGWWRHGIAKYFAQPAVIDLVGGIYG